jgi:hypothetical protein
VREPHRKLARKSGFCSGRLDPERRLPNRKGGIWSFRLVGRERKGAKLGFFGFLPDDRNLGLRMTGEERVKGTGEAREDWKLVF